MTASDTGPAYATNLRLRVMCTTPVCVEKALLSEELARAVTAHAEAVTALTKERSPFSVLRYFELVQSAERAWGKCEEARRALEEHTASHKC